MLLSDNYHNTAAIARRKAVGVKCSGENIPAFWRIKEVKPKMIAILPCTKLEYIINSRKEISNIVIEIRIGSTIDAQT